MQLLFSFLFGLYHIRNFSDTVRFVYQDSKSKGTPFPYFAAGRDNVYLINSSCDKGIPLTEKSVADEYLSFFSGLSTKQYEYLEIHNSLEEFLGSLYQRFQDNSGKDCTNIMAERRPCIFKLVTEAEINHYTDETLKKILIPYLSMFNKMNSLFLDSSSALEEFKADHSVMENGIKIDISPSDAEEICKRAESASEDDILLLHGEQDHLPKNYTFALFSTEELMILPNYGYKHIISIKNPALYHTFSAWFEVNKEMAIIKNMSLVSTRLI